MVPIAPNARKYLHYAEEKSPPPPPSLNKLVARASQDKASLLTIKSATLPRSKDNLTTVPGAKVPVSTHPSPDQSLSLNAPPVGPLVSSSSNAEDQQTLMDGIESMVRDTMSDVFAGREERERERNFATLTAPVSGLPDLECPLFVPPLLVASPHRILPRCSWVSQDTIDSIGNGMLEIDGLPKLHRTDELRHTYLQRSLKGVYQSLDGGPMEIIIGSTKLQSSFKDPTTFFLTWNIYRSIRTSFESLRGSGLTNWMREVMLFISTIRGALYLSTSSRIMGSTKQHLPRHGSIPTRR